MMPDRKGTLSMNTKSSPALRAVLAGAMLLCGAGARAATYYVATTGSDSSAGSLTAPFGSIQHGINAARAGDTVIVENGTYLYTGGGMAVTINSAGSSSAWITLKAQTPGGVILDCQLGCHSYINFGGSSAYWIIQGFDIRNTLESGLWSNSGGGKNIQVLGNFIHNIGNHYDSTPYGITGVYTDTGGLNWTISGNVFHDVGRTAVLTGTHDHCIYTHGSGMLIVNNIFYNDLNGWFVQTAAGFSGTIANNTFFGPNPYPGKVGQIVLWDADGYGYVRNNVFYNPIGAAISNAGASFPSGCSIDHNIVYSQTSGSLSLVDSMPSGCVQSNNKLNVNPLLTTPSLPNYNFSLMAGSPAIDAGVAIAGVTSDFNGVLRPQGAAFDMGAFEYGGGGAIVAAAPAISAVSAAGLSATGATIGWTTDQASDSQVVYGPTSAYGSSSALNATLTTSHSVALSGLAAGTAYHYAVKSRNSAGTLATSPDATFTTSAGTLPAGCLNASGGLWQNVSLPSQTGFFTAEYDATPAAANIDGVAGVSNGSASAFTSLAAAARFNNTGMIDARNGGSYAASAAVPYVAGLSYHFRLVVNLPTHTYSAYVKQGSNPEQLIGAGYSFRTEQSAVTTLNDAGFIADIGTLMVCNGTVTGAAAPTVISAVAATSIGQTTASIGWTTNNPSDSQVQYGPTTTYNVTTTLNSTPVTSHAVSLGGLTAGTLYHYHVLSRDAAGNLVTSPDATFTTTANTTGPVIGGVAATGVGASAATIGWTTDKAADSQVVYGPASTTVSVVPAGSIYTLSSALNTTMTTSHSVPLSGLTASTLYHYAVKSKDSLGNLTTSSDATFTTAAGGGGGTVSGCVTSSGSAWKNIPLTSETGSFTAEFDATPAAAGIDGVMGLSSGAGSAWTSMATGVRFNNTGKIDARSGNAYVAAASIPYSAGLAYHFRVVVNLTAHTYSVYVKQGANTELLIGSGYAFRSEQAKVTMLNNLMVNADIGSVTVCNALSHL
jgi:hypothetical protein